MRVSRMSFLGTAVAVVFSLTAAAFPLRDSVIVDAQRGVAYAGKPGGGIQALDLVSGRLMWSSADAAMPLATNGRLILARGEDAIPSPRLLLVVLDADGKTVRQTPVPLPEPVRGLVSDDPVRQFRVSATAEADAFIVSWTFHSRRGEPEPLNLSGAFRFEPNSGRTITLPAPALPSQAAPWRVGNVIASTSGGHGEALTLKRWDATMQRALPDVALSRKSIAELRSSDGAHLVVSERAGAGGADDPEYRWSIFSLETGAKLGEIRRDVSASPFFVHGDSVIYSAQPHGFLRGGEWVNENLKIESVRLSNGAPQWDLEVRDVEYHGPIPSEEPPARDEPVKPRRFGKSANTSRAIAPNSLGVVGGTWVSEGPGPITGGQSEGITNTPVVGAIEAIVAHPSNADVAWIGAVNGGVWKTTNATNAAPTWTAQTDGISSLSVGALALDPTDATSNTLVMGNGLFSSFSRVGGPRSGLWRTTNGGTNWTGLSATMSGKNVSGLAPRGATIVASVDVADSFVCSNIGILRSIDTGGSFTRIADGATGLPGGSALDLASDPTNNAVLYTAIKFANCTTGGVNGIYKSADTGATWARVSNAAMETLMSNNSTLSNVRIAVGASGQVFVGIIVSGTLTGLFRSPDASTWTQLDTPATNENGSNYGLQPEADGGQGSIHFSIVADPTDSNIVYVGGDRQPGPGDGAATFPNSVGANTYSGRLFRVNASLGAGTQATPLTHCQTALSGCNGSTSTSSNSAPHADSRRLVFDANGNILESDDGGIYRRTLPRGTGDWASVNGTLRITENHDIAWDTVSNMCLSGNQDNGTSEQRSVDAVSWSSILSGDGGDVAIDDISSASQSTRFASAQYLGSFRRRVVNSTGATTSAVAPALSVTGGGPAVVGQFRTPLEINVITPTRMLFAANNDLYESLDRGDTITALAFNLAATQIVYGGKSGGVDNAPLIYAISGTNVYVRTSGSGAPVLTTTAPGASTLRDITVDPSDWQKAYVINSGGQVFATSNNGGTWTDITGNLASGTTDLRSIAFVPGSPSAVVAGGVNGVFRMATTASGVWQQLGSGLSNAPVFDLDYDSADDALIAGTMGRGAWKLTGVSTLTAPPSISIGDVTVTEGNAGTVNANFPVTLSASSGATVTVDYSTADGTATQGSGTFSNTGSISIPSVGNATPYPSNITASGLTGTITSVTATLTGVTHTYIGDVDVLLVGPGGQSVILMSDIADTFGASALNFTFSDNAASSLSTSAPVSGTYKPTNLTDTFGTDTWSSPAPPSGYGSTMSVFNGTAPNGTWSLYVVDDFAPDSGTIAGGWSITITTTGGDYQGTSGTVTFTPGNTTGTITVLVNGDTSVESNETFFVNLANASNATISDSQGQGTITDDDGLAAPTNVVATGSGATSVDVTWTAAAGATAYHVYRSANHVSYTLVGSPLSSDPQPFTDSGASANTAYLYKVRSFNGSESADSNVDLATTVVYTDPTLTAQLTKVKLAHFTQLLTAVNAVRTLGGASFPVIGFTAPTPATNVTVRAQHLLDLRTALPGTLWTALGLGTPSFAETITAQSTKIKASHITELRNAVK